jgi:hypothetical protein
MNTKSKRHRHKKVKTLEQRKNIHVKTGTQNELDRKEWRMKEEVSKLDGEGRRFFVNVFGRPSTYPNFVKGIFWN